MRIYRTSTWLQLLLLAVAVGACESSGNGGPVVVTNDNVAELVFGAYCEHLIQCETELGPAFPSRRDCVDFFMRFALLEKEGGELYAAKDNPFLQVGSDRAKACIDRLAGAKCDPAPDPDFGASTVGCGGTAGSGSGPLQDFENLFDDIQECREAITGTLAEHDCCDARGGCGPGLFCERQNYSDTGTCLPAGGADESCHYRPCQDSLACSLGAEIPLCLPLLQLDEECGVAGRYCAEGLYCDYQQLPVRCATADRLAGEPCDCLECSPALYCDRNANPPVCRAYKQENDSCAEFDACAAGLECLGGICQGPVSLHIGDECDPDFEYLCPGEIFGGICQDDGTGSYRCAGPGLQGDRCDPQGEIGQECALSYQLLCDPATGTCQPMPGPNRTCQTFCAEFFDYFCAYSNPADQSGTCKPRVAENRDCSQGLEEQDILSACQFGFECDSLTVTCVPDQDHPTFQTCPSQLEARKTSPGTTR